MEFHQCAGVTKEVVVHANHKNRGIEREGVSLYNGLQTSPQNLIIESPEWKSVIISTITRVYKGQLRCP